MTDAGTPLAARSQDGSSERNPSLVLTPEERRAIDRIEWPDPQMTAVLRARSPAEKVAVANGMWRFARDMLRNLIRAERPEWSEAEVARETARRLASGAD